METTHTLGNTAIGFPKSLEEALAGAQQLGIKEEFARQEYHAKRAVGGKDGYGNPITSWTDHLLARWAIEQRKRAERPASGRKSGKRPTSPPPHFSSTDFNQSIEDF